MRTPLVPASFALTLVALLAACDSGSKSSPGAGSGSAGTSVQTGSPGAGGDGQPGGAGTGSAGDAGSPGQATGQGGSSGGSGQTGGAGKPSSAGPLSPTTFVFERKVTADRDHLVAMDYTTGETRVIATLAEGSVAGWKIDGVSVSPDRTRIVLASPYGATAADVATGLSTNILWSMDINGGDLRRLTPTFNNSHAGTPGFWIDVRNPLFTPDGQQVLFDYGESSGQGGYLAPWYVEAAGGSLPAALDLPLSQGCSVTANLAFQPDTNDLLVEHEVCADDGHEGYFLYPQQGGDPAYLIDAKGVSYSSEAPSFSPDGSVFVYTARAYEDSIQSLYAYLTEKPQVVKLIPGAKGRDIVNASFAPDSAHLVYCVREGDAYDLHVIDLTADPVVDKALTTDGQSCDPVF